MKQGLVSAISSYRSLRTGSKHWTPGTGSIVTLLLLSAGALFGNSQTAHFSGAQVYLAGEGTAILAIAADTKGDIFFTAQGAFLSSPLVQLSNSQVSPTQSTYPGPGNTLFACYGGCKAGVTIIDGFIAPAGLALDAIGDLYVLDEDNGTLSEILAVNGSIPLTSPPTIVTLAMNIPTPTGLAIDMNGNLFLAAEGNNSVEEVVAVNGAIPPSPTIRVLASGFNFPTGIAVDKLGNVYVGDTLNNAVKEIVAVNGTIPASPAIETLGNGFSLPVGVAVDNGGNLYVSDDGNSELKEILAVNGTIPPSPTIENLGTFTSTQAVALDASGNIYVGAGSTSGSVFQVSLNGANFGSANVGAPAPVIPLAFTFDTPGTLGSISVLTQGATGLDFIDAGSDTCTPGTAYSAGQTCFVKAGFTPKFAGARIGAAVLKDVNGNPIATGYLNGTGVGPQVSFAPGTETAISEAGLGAPTAVAFDGAGNLYVGSYLGLTKGTLSAGGYSYSTISSDILVELGIAVDGAGDIFVGDDQGERVVKETPTASGYVESTVSSGFYPMGVAVDASGNVYVVDQFGGRILMETLVNGFYRESAVVTGLSDPYGVAVDSLGNLYVVCAGLNGMLKETLTSNGYVQSTIPVSGQVALQSIAVDGVGNLYAVDGSSNNIIKETLTPNGYVESTVVSDLQVMPGPNAANVDPSGNLFVAYFGNNAIVKVDFSDPPNLNFAATQVGTTSADSPQIITLGNNGNAPLSFPVPATGDNPSIAPNFTLDSSSQSDCPLTPNGSTAPGILKPATSCNLPISFTPAVSGSVSGSLVLTDNNLNAAPPSYSSQTVALNGTVLGLPAISWPSPVPITFGTTLGAAQLSATANVPGTFAYAPAAGTVLGAGTQTLEVTFTPTDTADYTAATATVQLTVNQATPSISWSTPAAIFYGTALSGTQLNASSNEPGTFTYSPALGSVLPAGTQTLTVSFTPNDNTDYTSASTSVPITVN